MRGRRAFLIPGLCLTIFLMPLGCATIPLWPNPNWHYDFESAQNRARREQAATLVYYSESRPGRNDPLHDALRDGELSQECARFVRCRLYVSHEPDRRFVGQYGVTRAPAWIVIHPDGTYHSHMGAAAPADITLFIRESNPPGQAPASYGYLVNRKSDPEFSKLAEAQAAANSQQRPLLVIYTRLMSRDWTKLEPLLNSLEVRRAITGFVQCHMEVAGPWSETVESSFGKLRLPAFVVQRPDGVKEHLEQPNSSRAIVDFLRHGAAQSQDNVAVKENPTTADPNVTGSVIDE